MDRVAPGPHLTSSLYSSLKVGSAHRQEVISVLCKVWRVMHLPGESQGQQSEGE